MHSDSQAKRVLIGIGNELRGDDAAGLLAVRAIAGRLPPGWRAIEHSGEGASLLEALRGAEAAVLVDCTQSGAPPGTLRRIAADAASVASRLFHYSTHAFGVAEAIEVGRALGALPERLVIHGIEGACFTAGAPLSPEVAAAIEGLAAAVLADCAGLERCHA